MDNANCNPDQRTKPAYDPGWNDPPQFYNAHQPTPSRPRNFLNKRVAFPLTNASTSPLQAAPMSLPPMPVATNKPMKPSLLPAQLLESPEKEVDAESEKLMNIVKGILLQLTESYSELGSKANDIKRRLDVMEDMWLDNKLNNFIQLHMMELAYALRDNIPNKADDIHRALMVEYVSSVSPWMPGIKQLIHHSIARSELLAIDKEPLDVAE